MRPISTIVRRLRPRDNLQSGPARLFGGLVDQADNPQNALGLMRQIIAYDMGINDLPVEALDEQTLRSILAEQGLDGGEPHAEDAGPIG